MTLRHLSPCGLLPAVLALSCASPETQDPEAGASSSSSSSSGGGSSGAAVPSSAGGSGGASSSSEAALSASQAPSGGVASSLTGSSAAGGSSGASTVTWSGDVTADVAAGAAVRFTAGARVPAGATVRVGAGASFSGTGMVQVAGTLEVQGTAAAPVELGGVGVSVVSAGSASVLHATITNAPAGLEVAAAAGVVSFSHVVVTGAGTDMNIRGGTVSVDHCRFEGGGAINISAVPVAISHSYLVHQDTGSDKVVIGAGGSVDAQHNRFESAHCAVHINGAAAASTLSYNEFLGNVYAVMKASPVTDVFTYNTVGDGTGADDFSLTGGLVQGAENYYPAGCPATTSRLAPGCAAAADPTAGPDW